MLQHLRQKSSALAIVFCLMVSAVWAIGAHSHWHLSAASAHAHTAMAGHQDDHHEARVGNHAEVKPTWHWTDAADHQDVDASGAVTKPLKDLSFEQPLLALLLCLALLPLLGLLPVPPILSPADSKPAAAAQLRPPLRGPPSLGRC